MRLKESNKLLWLFVAVVLVLLVISFGVLASRYTYQQGLDLLRDDKLIEAKAKFETSLDRLPLKQLTKYVLSDQYKIEKNLGAVHFQLSQKAENVPTLVDELRTSSYYYQKALKLMPLDYTSAAGLASTVAAQHRVYARLYPAKDNIYDAIPAFEKALALRPNGVSIRFTYLDYLQASENRQKLLEEATKLASVYPQAYFRLRQLSYYDTAFNEAVQQGLEKAIEQEVDLRNAYSALSSLHSHQGDVNGAISYYQEMLTVWPDKNADNNYLQYGRLLLKAGHLNRAAVQFILAYSSSKNRDSIIRSIYNEYHRQKEYKAFIDLLAQLQKEATKSSLVDIYLAKSLAQADQVDLAVARLKRIDDQQYNTEKFYILAQIYQTQEDWDKMELAIQRATVLSPENDRYFSLFATALSRQEKYSQAELAMNAAIEKAEKPNRWYYNQRGWIRWSLKNYRGALDDWLQSIVLDPERASFYHHASLAYEKLDNTKQAKIYAEKALERAPTNESYLKHLQQLD